jgi:MYXO-CTERM domain-containing protein
MPDMEAGSCSMGCGPPGFQSFTDVSSHELIEAITDPDGTGWYDDAVPENDANNCGEIGDICAVGGAGEGATVAGFFVQNEWSNKNKACIAVDANAVVNDFTIAVSPTSVTVPLGGSATVTVTLTKKTGVGESVALTSPAAPTGLTASFSPASISSDGGTSTMTVSAGGALTPSVLTMNVKGTGSAVSETALLTVNVVAAAPDMASGGGGSGGSGDHGGGGCSVGGGSLGGSWAVAALFLLALAFRRRFV